MLGHKMTLEEFFSGNAAAREIFDALAREVEALGQASLHISKSQVAFRRGKNFAVVWLPGRYLRAPVSPLVLTLSFPERDMSSRWKEVVQVGPRRFTHHLELHRAEEIDDQVKRWLRSAWEDAAAHQA